MHHPTVRDALTDLVGQSAESPDLLVGVTRFGLSHEGDDISDPHGHLRELARSLNGAGVTELGLPQGLTLHELEDFLIALRRVTEAADLTLEDLLTDRGTPVELSFHGERLGAATSAWPETGTSDDISEVSESADEWLQQVGERQNTPDEVAVTEIDATETVVDDAAETAEDEVPDGAFEAVADEMADEMADEVTDEFVDEVIIEDVAAGIVDDELGEVAAEVEDDAFEDDAFEDDAFEDDAFEDEQEIAGAIDAEVTVETDEASATDVDSVEPTPGTRDATAAAEEWAAEQSDPWESQQGLDEAVAGLDTIVDEALETVESADGADAAADAEPDDRDNDDLVADDDPGAPDVVDAHDDSPSVSEEHHQIQAFRALLEEGKDGASVVVASPHAGGTPGQGLSELPITSALWDEPDESSVPEADLRPQAGVEPDPLDMHAESEVEPDDQPVFEPEMESTVETNVAAPDREDADHWDAGDDDTDEPSRSVPIADLAPEHGEDVSLNPEPAEVASEGSPWGGPDGSEDAQRIVEDAELYVHTSDVERPAINQSILEAAARLRALAIPEPIAEAVERLVSGSDPEERSPNALAHSLCEPDVVDALVARLAEVRTVEERDGILYTFQRLADVMAPALSRALSEVPARAARRNYMDALFTMGREAVRAAVPMLDDSRWFIVRNGVDVIGGAGSDDSVPRLTPVLSHPDARVRRAAVMAMAKLGGEEAGLDLIPSLDDPSSDVREAATMAVGHLRIMKALRPLLTLLDQEKDDEFQLVILRSLGQLGDPGAVPQIEKRAVGRFFSKPSKSVRIAAYRALATIGTPHARRLVLDAVEDRDPEVATVARSLASRLQ